MTRLRRYFILFVFTAIVCVCGSTIATAQSTPDCDCEVLHPDLGEAYFTCLTDGCTGVNVPVSGNVWVLALAGLVLAFVKFGGHTKLVGYYYSKIER